jgi:hypothetical protein
MTGVIPPPPLCACIGMSWGNFENYFLGSRNMHGKIITDRYKNLSNVFVTTSILLTLFGKIECN